MKKIIVFVGLFIFAIAPMMAQNKTARNDSEQMQYIRERYAAEQILAEQSKDPDVPNNYTMITRMENKAAVGQCKEQIEMYYDEIFENEEEPYPSEYMLTFVRRSYNIAARQFYEEFLYDTDGQPLFWFVRYDGFFSDDTSGKVEIRCYFREGKQFKTICKIADESGKMKETSYRSDFDEVCSSTLEHFQEFKALFDVYYNKYNENSK